MKKLLIINESLSDNLGDNAISEAMYEFCKKNKNFKIDLQDFSFRKSKSNINLNFLSSRKLDKLKLIKQNFRLITLGLFLLKSFPTVFNIAKRKYDYVIIGGGQLILSSKYSTFSLSLILIVIFLKITGSKIKLVAVGVGENFYKFDKFLFKLSFSLVDEIFVRDELSKKNCLNKFHKKVNLIPDISYYLLPKVEKITCQSKKEVMICPIEYLSYDFHRIEVDNPKLNYQEYCLKWQKIIKKELNHGNKILISSTTKKDYEFALNLKSYFSSKEISKIDFIYSSSWFEYLKIASGVQKVIAARMHGILLAHLLGKKVEPFIFSKKIEAYTNEYLYKNPLESYKIIDKKRSSILKFE